MTKEDLSKILIAKDLPQDSLLYRETAEILMASAYNLALEHAAEKAEVLNSVNGVPFVANKFSYTNEDITRTYCVYKTGILNLKITE